MVPSVSSQSDVDPNAFMLKVEQTTDTTLLEYYLDYSAGQVSAAWQLVHAYVLWRLHRSDTLRNFLLVLPSSFHEQAQYWLLLGLAYKDLPSCSALVEAYFRRALDMSPFRADLNYNLANLLQAKDPFLALKLYKKSLCIDSFQAPCWHLPDYH